MKNVLITLLGVISFGSSAVQCPKFDEDQLSVMTKSYELGRDHDLGLTLAALALKESSGGRYLINAISNDYGVFQLNVKTVCSLAGVLHNNFQCNMEIQNVVSDLEKAAEYAIETLVYWREYHGRRSLDGLVYERMIRSYNRGFSFDDAGGDNYWKKYKQDFHTIKQCVNLA